MTKKEKKKTTKKDFVLSIYSGPLHSCIERGIADPSNPLIIHSYIGRCIDIINL